MPYRSDAQRRYMHAAHPGIAARWDKETGGKVMADGDMKMGKPAMAAVMAGEDPADEGDGGDDTAALEDAGRAAMKAYASGDPIAFAKSIAACARLAPEEAAEGEAETPLAG